MLQSGLPGVERLPKGFVFRQLVVFRKGGSQPFDALGSLSLVSRGFAFSLFLLFLAKLFLEFQPCQLSLALLLLELLFPLATCELLLVLLPLVRLFLQRFLHSPNINNLANVL